MNVLVDFLPEAWRERQRHRQRRRNRILLLVPVAASLLVTELVLRHRVGITRTMVDNARAHETRIEQAAAQLRQQATRLATQQTTLEHDLQPLQAPRMIELLDALVAGMPAGVALHDVSLRLDPWSPATTPTVRVQASSGSTGQFERFLATLRLEPALPPLQCARTFRAGSGVGFLLESTTVPASPR
jgi:PAS domain-containing protein